MPKFIPKLTKEEIESFENMSYNEISESLDIPKGTVMSKLYYARKKLAKKLEVLRS